MEAEKVTTLEIHTELKETTIAVAVRINQRSITMEVVAETTKLAVETIKDIGRIQGVEEEDQEVIINETNESNK